MAIAGSKARGAAQQRECTERKLIHRHKAGIATGAGRSRVVFAPVLSVLIRRPEGLFVRDRTSAVPLLVQLPLGAGSFRFDFS